MSLRQIKFHPLWRRLLLALLLVYYRRLFEKHIFYAFTVIRSRARGVLNYEMSMSQDLSFWLDLANVLLCYYFLRDCDMYDK